MPPRRSPPGPGTGFGGGVSVAAADFNGDGSPDIVAGAGAGGGPRVSVLDGKTGQVLADFFAYEPSFLGGVNVAAADVTGDGKADVAVGSDPSCATAGACGPPPLGFATGFCTAGRIGDPCTSNAQCGLPADTCRLVVNYADVPDLQLNAAFLNRTTNPVAGFSPAHAGCSRKVDVALDASRRVNRLRIKATGTVFGRSGRDRDSFRYRR